MGVLLSGSNYGVIADLGNIVEYCELTSLSFFSADNTGTSIEEIGAKNGTSVSATLLPVEL